MSVTNNASLIDNYPNLDISIYFKLTKPNQWISMVQVGSEVVEKLASKNWEISEPKNIAEKWINFRISGQFCNHSYKLLEFKPQKELINCSKFLQAINEDLEDLAKMKDKIRVNMPEMPSFKMILMESIKSIAEKQLVYKEILSSLKNATLDLEPYQSIITMVNMLTHKIDREFCKTEEEDLY
jgi:hypothetical protein